MGNSKVRIEVSDLSEKIKVIVVDDVRETRDNIKALLAFERKIDVVGEAENGEEAIYMAREAHADIVLMDINMPVKDGIKATEEISVEVPDTAVIIMSVQNEQEYLRKAMAAGAKEYVLKPFTGDELVNTIIKTYNLETKRKKKVNPIIVKEEIQTKIISVFSTKGGVGKTTLATNLAIAIARETKKKVALVDLNLMFGDVAIHLNIYVKATIAELIKEINSLDSEMMEEYLHTHFSGVKVLPAPMKPEYAEYITAQHIEKIIRTLQGRYHYIIIDTAQNFSETTLAALDASDTVLFVSNMEVPTIKNVKTGLEVLDTLKYSDKKVKLVLNKATEQFGVSYKDFEDTVRQKIWASIPEDAQIVVNSINKGFPVALSRMDSKISKSFYDIASKITSQQMVNESEKGFLKKILKL
ncbi:MAG: response regulator receiver protein [Clostridiales bacterium]|nr:response regulator receiver protein [Clostridiales bacterium]